MKKTANIVLFSMVIAFIALSSPASADSPVQVALFYPIQIVDKSDDVKGIRLKAWSKSPSRRRLKAMPRQGVEKVKGKNMEARRQESEFRRQRATRRANS